MKRLIALFSAAVAFGAMLASAADNIAYSDDNVRFTVITDASIRMEYAPDGKFVNDKSQVAVVRDYPEVPYKVKNGNWIEITTPKVKLRYRKGSGKFTADNMSISGVKGAFQFTWKPGIEQKSNLKGTYRTLDGCIGEYHGPLSDNKKIEMEDGILARDGWTLIDDSESYLFDGSEDWDWVKERNSADGAQDWYFMAYGKDYRKALSDFSVFSGKVPLPPRYTFGYWWSRYWTYSDQELRDLIDKMEAYNIPLDVLVVDMDWHYIDGKRGAWTGFSWNKALFPQPDKFLNYLQSKDLKITLNLHPASGIMPFEVAYPQIAADMGLDPAEKKEIPWYGSDKTFMKSVFSNVLTPMEKEGVDFWWLDWQQYLNDLKLKDLSNTWWINYVFFSQQDKFTDKRPMLYHRWGGLGNHRYQIGFSGDAYVTWESLDFQPYFNSTASNVLYGFWSHDIGGHMFASEKEAGASAIDHIDPEMYVRWMQFGEYSPVLRTHSSKHKNLAKEPWVFKSDILDILTDIINNRYRMAPYIYTLAREAHDTSVSMCRPMYYDYPEAEEAYSFRNQYMFGDRMMIAPVTAPGKDGYATPKVWLPEGKWYEAHSGELLDGGKVIERELALDEYPVYVKAGSVLPFHKGRLRNLRDNNAPVELTVYPGDAGAFTMYEDGGDNKNYENECAWTDFASAFAGDTLSVNISPRRGSYAGMEPTRDYSIRVLCSDIPQSVLVAGREASYSYDPKELSLIIDLPAHDCSQAKEVKIVYPAGRKNLAAGSLGRMKRVVKAMRDFKDERDVNRVFDDTLASLGSVFVTIGYDPSSVADVVDEFENTYARLPEVLSQFGDKDIDREDRQWFLDRIAYRRF